MKLAEKDCIKAMELIFILLSIKTRIETKQCNNESNCQWWFLSYYPLKQGLKHGKIYDEAVPHLEFLSYYPLKQGLKHIDITKIISSCRIFILLSIKTRIETCQSHLPGYAKYLIFILLSIKTRIETNSVLIGKWLTQNFYPTIH